MKLTRALASFMVVTWGTWGCSSSTSAPAGDTGGSPDDTGSSSDTGSADAKDGGACPGTGGPIMVRGSAGFCVDTTEVTNKQYADFLAAKGSDTSGQDTWCGWNTTYTPSASWPATGKDAFPVAHVDWCDAFAFCKWAGKRLCGKIGGGSTPYADYRNAKVSQWQAACSADGTKKFPYGATYDGLACNGQDYGAKATIAVGSDTSCMGGYPGVFDMSGNVSEWEDTCDAQTGDTDRCVARGGTFEFKSTYLPCNGGGSAQDVPRNFVATTIGFRCCAE